MDFSVLYISCSFSWWGLWKQHKLQVKYSGFKATTTDYYGEKEIYEEEDADHELLLNLDKLLLVSTEPPPFCNWSPFDMKCYMNNS